LQWLKQTLALASSQALLLLLLLLLLILRSIQAQLLPAVLVLAFLEPLFLLLLRTDQALLPWAQHDLWPL
jgi:hypothetical protein